MRIKLLLTITTTLLASLFFFFGSSCKNDSDFFSEPSSKDVAKITSGEISQWLEKLPVNSSSNGKAVKKSSGNPINKLPFQVKWEKAQQNIIENQHVIRVPVSENACLIFTKENANSELAVYAYKWLSENKTKEKKFTGEVAWVSFQDRNMRVQKYKNGAGSDIHVYKEKQNNQKVNSSSISSTKNSQVRTQSSWLGSLLDSISCFFGASYFYDNYIPYSCGFWNNFGGGGGGGSEGSSGSEGSFSNTGFNWTTNGSNFSGNYVDNSGNWTNINIYGSGGGSGLSAIDVFLATLHIPGNELTMYEKTWYLDNPIKFGAIREYLEDSDNLTILERKEYLSWAISHLDSNPGLSIETFKNRFMGSDEGTDGEYDAEYWDNPNLTLPAQSLPSWYDFENNFPLNSNLLYNTSEKMFQSIGGDVGALYTNKPLNTCAIRLSKALNYSGIVLPNIPERTVLKNGVLVTKPSQTLIGADGKYYFLRAAELNAWMRKTFGTNDGDPLTPHNASHFQVKASEILPFGANLTTKLSGKKGIYCIVSSDTRWATGHADLLKSDATCGNDCHFEDARYIKQIDIWILN